MAFLDPHFRELYVDWRRKARAVVGNLRIAVGRYPDDPQLAALTLLRQAGGRAERPSMSPVRSTTTT